MEFVTSWIQGIIIAVIVATIIEMVLPNGNSKKYIKVVIGVYIIFTIVSPIISKITKNEFNVNSIMDVSKYQDETSTYKVNTNEINNNNNSNIKDIYVSNLKNDMKTKVEGRGYIVKSINISVEDDEEYTIKSVELNINKKDEEENKSNKGNEVNEIKIEVKIENNTVEETKSGNATDVQVKEIKEYLSSTYEIDKEKIKIN